jgi:4-amino-4-deoxy-L-arabinose transferase-like glycosyltransferase
LTLLGLSLRLWVAWDTRQHFPDWSGALSSSELSYLDLADSIRQGLFLEGSERMPLYPLFLAACYLILDHSYADVFYVQAVVGAAAICLTFLLARYFTGARLSLLAAALVALHPTLIWQVTHYSAEILYTALLLLAFWGLVWALAKPGPVRFLFAGLLLAAATLCYPVTLLFPVMLILLLPRGWSFKGKTALTLSYALATIGVFLFLSYQSYRADQTFSLANTFGTSLWWGSPELYFLMQDQQPISQVWDWYLNPAANGGHDAFSSEGNRYFAQRALDSISTYPDIYAVYSLLKLSFFWIGHPTLDWPDYAVFNIEAMRPYFSVPRIAAILAARVLPIIAVIALIILHELHGQVRRVMPLVLICSYFMVVYALTYPEIRFSEPLYPILVTIIATAVKPKEFNSRVSFQNRAISSYIPKLGR